MNVAIFVIAQYVTQELSENVLVGLAQENECLLLVPLAE
jgi:hypothetical protein